MTMPVVTAARSGTSSPPTSRTRPQPVLAAVKSDGQEATWILLCTASVAARSGTAVGSAEVKSSGPEATCGDDDDGVGSGEIRDRLASDEQDVAATGSAAGKSNGQEGAWGDGDASGDSSRARDQLASDEQDAVATGSAAVESSGQEATWGMTATGDGSQVRDQPASATSCASAAVKGDRRASGRVA